jgi:hypothetical protein
MSGIIGRDLLTCIECDIGTDQLVYMEHDTYSILMFITSAQ